VRAHVPPPQQESTIKINEERSNGDKGNVFS